PRRAHRDRSLPARGGAHGRREPLPADPSHRHPRDPARDHDPVHPRRGQHLQPRLRDGLPDADRPELAHFRGHQHLRVQGRPAGRPVQLLGRHRAVQLLPEPPPSADLQLGRLEGQPVEPVVISMRTPTSTHTLQSSTFTPRPQTFANRIADPLFVLITYGIIAIAMLLIIYPLYFIVIASISDPSLVQQGKVVLIPRGVTLDGYLTIFGTSTIVRGFMNSVLYTVVGTALSVSMILFGAYALARKDMPGRNFFMILFVITMFFDGGMIARYLVVKELGLLDTMWAVVLPGAVGVWNLIIARTFFEQNLSPELREAAQLDGASDFRFFFGIALPLSKPLIVLMAMIHIVANWNAFFDAMI